MTAGDRVRVVRGEGQPETSFDGRIGTVAAIAASGTVSVLLDGMGCPLTFGASDLEPRALSVRPTARVGAHFPGGDR